MMYLCIIQVSFSKCKMKLKVDRVMNKKLIFFKFINQISSFFDDYSQQVDSHLTFSRPHDVFMYNTG